MITVIQGRPLVSVLMPVYNNASYLPAAIDSILSQTCADFELLILDDGSSDDSAEIIRHYAKRDGRVTPVWLDHGGVARALNAGIDLARGKWIARMDSDDIALPERLAVQIHWMQQTGVDICGGQIETFGAEQRLWWFPHSHAGIGAELVFRAALSHPLAMFRAEILKENPYDPETVFEDYELWTRLWFHYRMGNPPQVLLKYRRHPGQTQHLSARQLKRDFGRCRFRYVLSRFPDTPLAGYVALAKVGDRQPLGSAHEMEQAGEWLTRLAALPDPTLRQRMALRWRDAWKQSSALGAEGDRIFFHFQRGFERPFGTGGDDDD